MLSDRDQLIMSKPDLQSQLIVITAGLAGERIAFGHTSTSVNDDLHAATALARSMVTSFGMSEALGLVTIGEKSGEVFLGASLQDLGSVGPETLNLIDNEIERLVGDAEARAAVDPRSQLEQRRGDRQRAARAGDALGRRARRGALDRPGDLARGAARGAPRRAATLHHARPQASVVSARLAARQRGCPRRRWSSRWSRWCFSTTGLADAARNAVISAIDGHPVSTKPHAGGLLRARQEQANSPPPRSRPSRTRAASAARPPNELAGTCPPRHGRPRHLVPGHRSLPADQGGRRQEQLHLGQQSVRGRRRLAALRRASCSAPPNA